jgi:hypothetical protein
VPGCRSPPRVREHARPARSEPRSSGRVGPTLRLESVRGRVSPVLAESNGARERPRIRIAGGLFKHELERAAQAPVVRLSTVSSGESSSCLIRDRSEGMPGSRSAHALSTYR